MIEMAIYQQPWFNFSLGALAEVLIEPLYVWTSDGSVPLDTRPIFRDVNRAPSAGCNIFHLDDEY
jgi:hypothetical protein